MSTKFSQRPAATKKPWICKASPPAYLRPAAPPSLLATVYLKREGIPASISGWSRSLLLLPTHPSGWYQGSTGPFPNALSMILHWKPGDQDALATASWDIPAGSDSGIFPLAPVAWNLTFSWLSFELLATMLPWITRLRITD